MKSFWKIQGAGNDFVLFPFANPWTESELKNEIPKICNRHFGIGADGVIFLEKSEAGWFWDFYNSDASPAAICGNAARATLHWLSSQEKSAELKLLTKVGEIFGNEIFNSEFEVTWSALESPKSKSIDYAKVDLTQNTIPECLGLYQVNVGIPHFVLVTKKNVEKTFRDQLSPKLLHHPFFGSENTNVTWVNLENSQAVTFEKGVEAETLACGSGAVAAFLALETLFQRKNFKAEALILYFPGGPLSVRRSTDSKIWLGGDSKIVFKGEI